MAFEKIGDAFAITGIELVASADVPDIDDATFQKFVADAKQNCPVSKALAAIEIRVKATLEQMAARDPQPESRQLRETTKA